MKPETPKVYINDVLVAFYQTFEEYPETLEQILQRIGDARLQINLEKSALCQKVLEYVSFWLGPNGYKPLASRIEGILDAQPPQNKKEVKTFQEMIDFIKNVFLTK